MATSYLEQMQTDPALRAFVESQRAQAAVELSALKVEYARQGEQIAAQRERIRELERQVKRRRGEQ